ncbi:MAG: hypothetical protein L6N96_06605 [Candidatus Methylarchaceae archaeon HK02M2]|nr:hypothetical protein [Candidatus Methylarchaceae archaeon HK02M2]
MKKYAIIMIVMLLMLLPLFPYKTDAQITIDKISHFNHQMILNNYGFILVNDTIVVKNNFEEDATLTPINITYPSEIHNLIAAYTIRPADFNFSKFLTDDYTTLILSPPQDYKIPPGENVTISLKMYLLEMFSSDNELNYTASLPLVPALNLPIEKMNSSFSIPTLAFFPQIQYENFTIERINLKWTMRGNFSNVNEGFFVNKNVTITATEDVHFALLEFSEAKRELVISPLGDIKVLDTITMTNYGIRELSKIKPSLLIDNFRNIIIFPPLSNPFPNSKSDADNSQIDIGAPLKNGEKYSVRLEYLIKSEDFINVKDNLFELQVPLRPPIDGVINEYTIKISYPDGFLVHNKTEVFKVNANPLDNDELKVVLQYGSAWASVDVVPVASLIFVTAIIASLTIGGPMVKEEEMLKKKIKAYTEAFDKKIKANNKLMDTYKERQYGQISKSEFDRVRQSIEGRKKKASIDIAKLMSGLIELKSSLQKPLTNIEGLSYKYDGAIRDLLSLYEQFYTKSIKSRIFERLLQSDQKRLSKIEKKLLGNIEIINREAELKS